MKTILRTGSNTDYTDWKSADYTDDQCNHNKISVISAKGVTLIEILLAVVILSVGMVGVLRAYAVSISTLEISQDHIDAIQLLKTKMADIEETIIENKGISSGSSDGEFDAPFDDYQWAWETKKDAPEGLYELDLRVYNPDKSRQFALVTYAENKDYVPPEH